MKTSLNKIPCMKIDLNADLGEGYGIYRVGEDTELLKIVSSANIACGFHAGDPMIMDTTITLCKQHQVSIGAHPSYPDLNGFGRREMNLSLHEISCIITYQLGALHAFAKQHKTKITHFKPHGALYNRAAQDSSLAKMLCETLAHFDDSIIFVGLAHSEMITQAKHLGLYCANEVFADRAYNDDATLVSRQHENAVLHDCELVVQRALKMIREGKVTTLQGKEIDLQADTICVHGDTKESLEFVTKIRMNLQTHGITIAPLHTTIK